VNIYFETPYMDASSRYLIYHEYLGDPIVTGLEYGQADVWRLDLVTGERSLAAEGVLCVHGAAVSPDLRWFYALRRVPEGVEVLRVDIAALETQAVLFAGAPGESYSLGSVTPDGDTYITGGYLGPHRFGLVRLDLATGQWRVVHEGGDDLCNPHPQIEPGAGRDVLVQHNRGAVCADDGAIMRLVGEEGATLFIVGLDGGKRRPLPVGLPDTLPCQGHQCWIGETGDILLTVAGGSVAEMEQHGTLLRMRPGDDRAQVVARGYAWCHAGASRDGRFFVSDTVPPWRVVVGAMATGRARILCDPACSDAPMLGAHPHPYLSPDRQWVILNSDRSGTPQVYGARVPAGLLEELAE
jgi:hypothetical protein